MTGPARFRTVDPRTRQGRKGRVMAKASSANADKVADYGVAIDRSSELGGYTVNFVTITKSHDLGPMLGENRPLGPRRIIFRQAADRLEQRAPDRVVKIFRGNRRGGRENCGDQRGALALRFGLQAVDQPDGMT